MPADAEGGSAEKARATLQPPGGRFAASSPSCRKSSAILRASDHGRGLMDEVEWFGAGSIRQYRQPRDVQGLSGKLGAAIGESLMVRRASGFICALALTGGAGYLTVLLLTAQGRIKVMYLFGRLQDVWRRFILAVGRLYPRPPEA
jgi:hypothetical protein